MKKITRRHSPNVSTTPITAMGCRQCLPLSVVQLKGKHYRKPHCRNGVVDTYGQSPFGSYDLCNRSFIFCLFTQTWLLEAILKKKNQILHMAVGIFSNFGLLSNAAINQLKLLLKKKIWYANHKLYMYLIIKLAKKHCFMYYG